jgi:hypothetical protein
MLAQFMSTDRRDYHTAEVQAMAFGSHPGACPHWCAVVAAVLTMAGQPLIDGEV